MSLIQILNTWWWKLKKIWNIDMQITTEMQASVIIQSYSLKISFELKHAFFFLVCCIGVSLRKDFPEYVNHLLLHGEFWETTLYKYIDKTRAFEDIDGGTANTKQHVCPTYCVGVTKPWGRGAIFFFNVGFIEWFSYGENGKNWYLYWIHWLFSVSYCAFCLSFYISRLGWL